MSGDTEKTSGTLQDDCVALDNFEDESPSPSTEKDDTENETDADSSASGSTPPDNAQALQDLAIRNKKRVSFPETLIISFLEPPDPWSWRHVVPCTRDQVLNAYRRSCDAHGIKPLPKVIQQLKAIENYNIRCDLFSLKGERLDQRHIESLEEVFKRLQFKMLDLEATHLDDEGAIAIFEMIEYYESGCKVNLAFNRNIGIRGWLACSRMIKRTPCLDCLDVKNCVLNDQSMPILGRSLRLGSVLTILHMENCNLSGRPLMILVAALKLNDPLQELFLADNGLMPSDAIQLGNLLKFNHKLYLLDLRNNHLQDVGLSHLCDGLFEQNLNTGLNTLVLWNNQITFQGMNSLTRALLSTKSLQTLNLGHNHLTNEGIFKVKEGLLANASLLRIGLQGCRLSCEAAVALAEFIADSQRLLRIDLRDNDIKTAGLMALAQGLRHSKTVTRLDLDKNAKKENGVKDYADQQRVMQEEITSVLERNRLDAIQREEEAAKSRLEKLRQEEEEKSGAGSEGKGAEQHTSPTEADKLHLLLPSVPPAQSLLESPGVDMAKQPSFTPVPSATPDSPAKESTASSVYVIPDPPKVPPAPPLPQKKRKLFTVKRVSLPLAESAPPGDGKSLIDHIVQFSSSRQKATIVKAEEAADETSELSDKKIVCDTDKINETESNTRTCGVAENELCNSSDKSDQVKSCDNTEGFKVVANVTDPNGAASEKDLSFVKGEGTALAESSIPSVSEVLSSGDCALDSSSAGQSVVNHVDDIPQALEQDSSDLKVSESPDSGFLDTADVEKLGEKGDNNASNSVEVSDALRQKIKLYVERLVHTACEQYTHENSLASNIGAEALKTEISCDVGIVDGPSLSEQLESPVAPIGPDDNAKTLIETTNGSPLMPCPGSNTDPECKTYSLAADPSAQENVDSCPPSSDRTKSVLPNTETTVTSESPNFHTDFSLMNLTEELTSAIDENTEGSADISNPDDFEKELDDMLASVQSGILLPSQ